MRAEWEDTFRQKEEENRELQERLNRQKRFQLQLEKEKEQLRAEHQREVD